MGGELRVEMKHWQTCQLNTAGGIPEVLEMWSCHKNHHTRHTPQLQLLPCTYTAEHSSDATSQCTKESLFNMTPPLCYANPDCPSTHHLPLILIMHPPGSHHAKHTYAKL